MVRGKKTTTDGIKTYHHDIVKQMIGKKIIVYRPGTKNGLSTSVAHKLTIVRIDGRIAVCKNSNGDEFNISIDEAYLYFVEKKLNK